MPLSAVDVAVRSRQSVTVMVAARKLIEDALREPMRDIGWTPRAAGWFTVPVAPRNVGVAAVTTSSAHSASGTGDSTLHIHLRDEDVERVVADMCESKDDGYRTTTAATSLGYLMPGQARRDWFVSAETANSVAVEMAAATREYAVPFLSSLAADPQRLFTAVVQSPAYSTSVGICRAVVLLAQIDDRDGASELLEEHLAALGERTDAAAAQLRDIAGPLRKWLDGTIT